MKLLQKKQRLVGIAVALALLATLGLASASGLAVVDQELLVNGSFEGGFAMVPGCGMVGAGWGCFTNGGMADYGFYDDQWQPVLGDGKHSQLIEISTLRYPASDPDRYAGIYQSVGLVKGQEYEFRLLAGMRERGPDPNEDPYRYRLQWGYTVDGSADWTQVTNWAEMPFDKIDERTAPTGLESYSVKFVAPSSKITLFVRAWKKWGTTNKELDVNLDSLSIWGPGVKQPVEPAVPVVILPGPVIDDTVSAEPPACGGANLVANGDFEGGFTLVPGCGMVGNGWGCFNNDGSAGYGYYDEEWPPVVHDGAHGQLIEINTKEFPASEADRFAGILQAVRGLKKGATYEFSVWGQMREEAPHPDEDMYRYRVEWGYAPLDANPSPADITNWVELPWDTIYSRIEPGPMAFYAVKFQAPGSKVILGLRAWKKWGTSYRELDVNLDTITLVRCAATPPPCTYVVRPGDSLLKIARQQHTSVAGLMELNTLANPDELIVGQELAVRCGGEHVVQCGGPLSPCGVQVAPCGGSANPCGDPKPKKPPEAPAKCAVVHTVVRGDTLYGVAKKYNTSLGRLVDLNHIADPNLIYVGQKFCVSTN
jgi:LysM repeat protein